MLQTSKNHISTRVELKKLTASRGDLFTYGELQNSIMLYVRNATSSMNIMITNSHIRGDDVSILISNQTYNAKLADIINIINACKTPEELTNALISLRDKTQS